MAAIKTQAVPAVEKTLTIVELLAESKAGLGLPELVQLSGFAKSSVHCVLVTLERRGYLYRNERTGRYLFGFRLFSLANMAVSGLKLREQAAPFLRSLMESTGLTVHMAILERYEAVLIAKFEPAGMGPLATWVGKRMDVHCTALGKALIAFLTEEELNHILREHGLPRHNDNTLATARKLKEDLAKVLRTGYALDDEEDEIGLRCIGAPVLGPDNRPLAALSVSGTTAQVTSANLKELAHLVRQTAGALEQALAPGVRAAAAGGALAV
jgi:DNA-binding IclR family transcriptional regulator